MRASAVIIQRSYRDYLEIKYQRCNDAASTIQIAWRSYQQQQDVKRFHHCATVIQRKWKQVQKSRHLMHQEMACVRIQQSYRAWKVACIVRLQYQTVQTSVLKIQRFWRTCLEIKSLLAVQEKAAFVIQQRYRACKAGSVAREEFQAIRRSVLKIQRYWRAYRENKTIRERHENACITIQQR